MLKEKSNEEIVTAMYDLAWLRYWRDKENIQQWAEFKELVKTHFPKAIEHKPSPEEYACYEDMSSERLLFEVNKIITISLLA